MKGIPQPLYDDLTSALREAGRDDLAERLKRFGRPGRALTSGQAAEMLGVCSTNTVKNWLEAGFFPGAYKTAGGHWRFPVEDVVRARECMATLHATDPTGELSKPGPDNDDPSATLL